MHSRCLCYLDLTAVVKPLNVVGVGVLARWQAKLLDHLGVHQIVAANSIDYGVHTAVFDDEKSVKQVVPLYLIVGLHFGTQSSMHDQGPVLLRCTRIKNFLIRVVVVITSPCMISTKKLVIVIIRSTNIPVVGCNVCPFAWAISLHMANSMAAVPLNARSPTRRRGSSRRFCR